jgi:hypothetical protein
MLLVAPLLLAAALPPASPPDEKLTGIACRSVHLGYPAPDGTAFYNEVEVEKSAEGTYFCAIGFNGGYFGIQEQGRGRKVAIFSVWDPGDQDDPNAVAADERVKVLHQGEGVRIGRFGNEGTGGQSFYPLAWEVGQKVRFLVAASPDTPGRTAYSAYLYLPAEEKWLHMATFSTLTERKLLGGYYSFVEDFKRDRTSTTHARRALFGPAWVRAEDGQWQPVPSARFTADSNKATNIDAGPAEGRPGMFYLSTGGDTPEGAGKLREPITAPEAPNAAPPADLPIAGTPK